jgi:TonB family protein
MKLNCNEHVKPNFAGLTPAVQQAEMKLILADLWPALKPLPVFKYVTDDYRAEIHFDRTRGEWVCRKISLPGNKVQELRGGLTEMTLALPHSRADVSTESVEAEPQAQNLESKRNRRLETIREWRENFENGALYSGLQDFLSESQQHEIYDSVRMTLTARQLQFNAKNVEFVFDSLWKAGGRLATLIEIAERNKAEREGGAQPRAETTALDPEGQVPAESAQLTRERRLEVRTTPASLAYVTFGDTNGGIVLNVSEKGMAVAVADQLVTRDDLARVNIRLPNSREGIELSAQIVWLSETKKGAGIRFVDLTSTAHEQISNWIASEKRAPELGQPAKLVGRDKQPLEISSRRSRMIFSDPSVRDEEAAACFEEMFPSETTCAKQKASENEFKPEQKPLETLVASHTDAGDSVVVSASEISSGVLSFEEDLHERVFRRTAVAGLRPQGRSDQSGSRGDRFEGPTSPFRIFEISGFQAAAFVFLIATICLTAGTLGHSLLGRRVQDTQKSTGAVGATSSAKSNRVGQTTAPVSAPAPSERFDAPPVNPPAPETQGLRAENPSTQPSVEARSTDSPGGATLTGPPSAVTSRPANNSDDSAANKLANAPPAEPKSKENARDSESFAKAPSTSSNSSPAMQSKPSANPEVGSERDRSSALFARSAPPSARPEPAHPPKDAGTIGGAIRQPAPRRAMPAMSAATHQSRPSVLLVTAPAQGSKPFRVTFPQKAIAASSTFAIASQLSVVIPPEPGAAIARRPARLQAGDLISYVWPRYPTPGDRDISTETVKVRVTIGKLGQVMDIRLLSGSTSLLPAAKGAIRQWRYKPTLLNQRPVRAQQDVTIEFRAPQHLSHVGAQRMSRH